METEGRRPSKTCDTAFVPTQFCFATALTLGLSLHGAAINFDDLTGGNCNLCGPSVTNQYAALGVTFNNPTYPGEDTADTNLTQLVPQASPPNMLYVFQGGLLSDPPALPFQILFSVPVTMVGFDFGSSLDSFLKVDAYDVNSQLIESLMFVGGSAPIGLAGFAGIQESTQIARLDVSYHPDNAPNRTFNFSIDNLAFQEVPEPSTFLLMAVGVLGLVLRSLKRHSRN
jgi:hypothetical protein